MILARFPELRQRPRNAGPRGSADTMRNVCWIQVAEGVTRRRM